MPPFRNEQAPFIKQTPERAYYNILSIAAKVSLTPYCVGLRQRELTRGIFQFPWRSKDALSPQSDQQNKALQLVRGKFTFIVIKRGVCSLSRSGIR